MDPDIQMREDRASQHDRCGTKEHTCSRGAGDPPGRRRAARSASTPMKPSGHLTASAIGK
jgi:hypothetical protein